MKRRLTTVCLVLCFALASAGIAAAHEQPLYKRVGGYDAIAAVTDDFLGRLATDAQLSRFFAGVNAEHVKSIRQLAVDLLCQSTGGPCYYLGRDMKSSHAGLGITESDWHVMVKHFLASLAKFQVPQKEQDELVAIVATLKKDMVEKP